MQEEEKKIEPMVDIDSGLLNTYDWALKYLLNQKIS